MTRDARKQKIVIDISKEKKIFNNNESINCKIKKFGKIGHEIGCFKDNLKTPSTTTKNQVHMIKNINCLLETREFYTFND